MELFHLKLGCKVTGLIVTELLKNIKQNRGLYMVLLGECNADITTILNTKLLLLLNIVTFSVVYSRK